MTASRTPAVVPSLADAAARRSALVDSHRTLLVEAGAGSGKTSLMAGRVALLFAAGVAPRHVAAITFTELAAADLAARIRSFVARLLAGDVPAELAVALPDGLDGPGREHLAQASDALDDLTSTTIHGFCQALVRPYPVEADVDPGARVADEAEAGLLFDDLRARWLRERLGAEADPAGAIAAMIGVDLAKTLTLVDETIDVLRAHRDVRAPTGGDVEGAYRAFVRAVAEVEAAIDDDAPPSALPFREGARALAAHLTPHAGRDAALALAALTLPKTHLRVERGGVPAYRVYGTKTAWCKVDTTSGEARHARGAAALAALETAQARLGEAAAARVLQALMAEVGDLLLAYGERKRDAAMLDFDDLLVTAERLLRDHEGVRRALAARYQYVLVDEFQDTDPLQAAVLWRLCGDPPAGGDAGDPLRWTLRPGALFVVGDPKQSIYRFRGADVHAYAAAKAAIAGAGDGAVLNVRTNFRSVATILAFANERFAGPLSRPGQSGFEALAPWREDADGPHVARVTIEAQVPVPGVAPSAADRRDLEATGVAESVAALIGRHPLPSRGGAPCEAGDIALLAPTGSDLWRFERALEAQGVSVRTQAGKDFYGRQEVHDLIALVRAIADDSDRLALGALLRGPLVGCSDETLLDVSERLFHEPRAARHLAVSTDPDVVGDEAVAATLRTLQSARELARSATPYRVLWEAIGQLRVRATLHARHGRHAQRALANVDRFLEGARPYGVRGIAAFARDLKARWVDGERAVEGRSDTARDAVTLLTVHSSKGLEWPVVIPVNTFCDPRRTQPPVVDRSDRTLHARVLGSSYPALVDALAREAEAEAQERVRLLYVCATRAQDLLVVPTPGFVVDDGWWCRVVDLATESLPELALPERSTPVPGTSAAPVASAAPGTVNEVTRERFELEAARVRRASRTLDWQSPSRLPDDEASPLDPPRPREEGGGDRVDADVWPVPAPILRGRVLHALMQEVLGGELGEAGGAIARRAGVLVARLGGDVPDDDRDRLHPAVLEADVRRGLAVPDVAALRDRLVPEVPVYAYEEVEPERSDARTQPSEAGQAAVVTVGIADAVAFADDGSAELVVDWKGDAEPPPERIARYVAQVRRYLEVLGAPRGMLVFLASGAVVEVAREA